MPASGRFYAEGDGVVPPSTNDFNLPPIFESIEWLTKPVLLVFLSVILVSVFFILSARKAAVVPSKLQFAGESVYAFVRNDLARDVIGHEFMRFVPYLFTLFTFVLTNNIFGIVPFLQFPAMSHVAFPYVLAIFTFNLMSLPTLPATSTATPVNITQGAPHITTYPYHQSLAHIKSLLWPQNRKCACRWG